MVVNFGNAHLPPGEQARQPAGAHAPHGVGDYIEIGFFQGVQVNQTAHTFNVGLGGVNVLHQPTFNRFVKGNAGHVVFGFRQMLFHIGQFFAGNSAAVIGANLEAVIGWRVVAGGDIDAAPRRHVQDGVRNDRRGHRSRRQIDVDIICRHHFGDSGGKVFAMETVVVADNDATVCIAFFFEELRKGMGDTAHVGKGVILSNDATPTVRPEFDFVCHGSLLFGWYHNSGRFMQVGEIHPALDGFFQSGNVGVHHHLDQSFKRDFRFPAQFGTRF